MESSKVFFVVAQMMFVATCLSEVECPERDIHRWQSHRVQFAEEHAEARSVLSTVADEVVL